MPHLLNQNHSKFLADEIKEAEWHVMRRHQLVDFRASTLVRKIYQQLTDPVSLLLAGGVGFIIGELTKRQPSSLPDTKDKARHAGISPLKVALNLLTSAQTLYTALPLAWLMKSRYRPGMSAQAPRPKSRPVPTKAMQNRRKYNRRKPLS
jgi:hypothetical protein